MHPPRKNPMFCELRPLHTQIQKSTKVLKKNQRVSYVAEVMWPRTHPTQRTASNGGKTAGWTPGDWVSFGFSDSLSITAVWQTSVLAGVAGADEVGEIAVGPKGVRVGEIGVRQQLPPPLGSEPATLR